MLFRELFCTLDLLHFFVCLAILLNLRDCSMTMHLSPTYLEEITYFVNPMSLLSKSDLLIHYTHNCIDGDPRRSFCKVGRCPGICI